jgi:hypothetical protein
VYGIFCRVIVPPGTWFAWGRARSPVEAERSSASHQLFAQLLLYEYQLAVFDFDVSYIIGQLQLIALFG